MHAMKSPQMETWFKSSEREFDNATWTEECQGVTTDGQHWYISNNNENLRAIYKFSIDFLPLGVAPLGNDSHIGDIDYYEGNIYAPLEDRKVAIFDTSPKLLKIVTLGHRGITDNLPWCAVNPWNGYLYTSTFDRVKVVHAYDLNGNFVYKGTLVLGGPSVGGVQGACFSKNGHFYLTSDIMTGENASKDIRGYSAINGAFLGSQPVSYNDSTLGGAEEMEGLCIWPITVNGIPAQVHVIILDNDATNNDDVVLQRFTVPDESVL